MSSNDLDTDRTEQILHLGGVNMSVRSKIPARLSTGRPPIFRWRLSADRYRAELRLRPMILH